MRTAKTPDTDPRDGSSDEHPQNYAEDDTLVRDYHDNGRYIVELTSGGYVKVTDEDRGRWTKVSFQSFVKLSENITGVIQGGDGND